MSQIDVKEIKGTGIFPEPEPYVFRPVKAFRYKLYLYVALVFILITFILTLILSFILFLSSFDGDDPSEFLNNLRDFLQDPGGFAVALTIYFMLSLLWIVLSIIIIPIYLSSFKYVVHGNEIVVHKGLINKMEKHVPFRTITNVATRAGIFDRLLGIGTVEIHTAALSSHGSKPEEKIEGIRVYHEVRDYILTQLRLVKSSPLGLGVQEPAGEHEKVVEAEDSTGIFNDRFLTSLHEELQEIKKILKDR